MNFLFRFASRLGVAVILTLPFAAQAQTTPGVGIGTTAPDVSAALDIVSSSKGALLPRVASTADVANPATGLLVFQTGAPAGFYYNAGTPTAPSWQQLVPASGTAFIRNGTTLQTSANFNIDGSGTAGGTLAGGTLRTDPTNANDGTFTGGSPLKGLVFGAPGTGEGIGSNRNGTVNSVGVDIYTNYTPRLSVANNGNVGIGTSSPRGPLDVAGPGSIYLASSPNVGTTQSLYLPGHLFLAPYNGSNVSYLQARRADDSGTTALQLRTYNNGTLTEALHLAGNGNVGIGTTNPVSRLSFGDALHPNAPAGRLAIYEDPSQNFYGLGMVQNPASNYGLGLWGGTSGAPYDGSTGVLPHLYLDRASGGVGIGTLSPTQKLDVDGTARLRGLTAGVVSAATDGTLSSSSATTAFGTSFIQNTTTPQTADFNVTGTGTVGGLLAANGSAAVAGTLRVDAASANDGTGYTGSVPLKGIQFGATNSGEGIGSARTGSTNFAGLDLYTGYAQRLSIKNNGNVGINNTNPGSQLDVVGNMRVSNPQGSFTVHQFSPSGTTILMGTFQGLGNNGPQLRFQGGGTNGTADYVDLGEDGTGNFTLETNDVTRLTVLGNASGTAGNVGIGATNPTQKLEVAGTIYSTSGGFKFPNGSVQTVAAVTPTGTDFIQNQTAIDQTGGFRVSGNGTVGGNVGIGTPAVSTARLTLSPSTAEPKLTLFNGAGSSNYYGLGISSFQQNYHVGATGGSHVFYAGGTNGDGTELLRIQGNGNVGIGTTAAPAAKLEVVGNVRIPAANNYTYATAKSRSITLGSSDFQPELEAAANNKQLYRPTSSDDFYPTSNGGILRAALHLPDNATITSFTVYYSDAFNPENLTVSLRSYTPGASAAGTTAIIGTFSSAGASTAYTSATTAVSGAAAIIDTDKAYYIRAEFPIAANSLTVSAVRVNYTVTEVD